MNILVTGGGGMLATAIRNIPIDAGLEICYCNKADLDITDLGKVLRWIDGKKFDVIINCAAYTNVERAESDVEAAYAVNEAGAGNLALAAQKLKAYLVHISTDAVYDGTKSNIYYEGDDCNPLSVYSKSKYAGEQAIINNHNSGIIIRTSWLYSLDKANFVTAIINKARDNGVLSVVHDQLGTPTFTYDLARAIISIIDSKRFVSGGGIGIYHYSNEGAVSWYDFAVNICRILKIQAQITPVASGQYPSKVTRPFHAIMSKTKIKEDFNLTIPYWRDSLADCLSLYKLK